MRRIFEFWVISRFKEIAPHYLNILAGPPVAAHQRFALHIGPRLRVPLLARISWILCVTDLVHWMPRKHWRHFGGSSSNQLIDLPLFRAGIDLSSSLRWMLQGSPHLSRRIPNTWYSLDDFFYWSEVQLVRDGWWHIKRSVHSLFLFFTVFGRSRRRSRPHGVTALIMLNLEANTWQNNVQAIPWRPWFVPS